MTKTQLVKEQIQILRQVEKIKRDLFEKLKRVVEKYENKVYTKERK